MFKTWDFLLFFFGEEIFNVFYGAHELGRENNRAIFFIGDFYQRLQVSKL